MAKEQELEDVLNKIDSPDATPTPATPPVQTATETAQPENVSTSTEKTVQTPETPASPATPSPEKPSEESPSVTPETVKPDQPLYAGKYFDKYNLMNGVMESNKAAGHDNKELVALFKKAEETGDYKPVEAKYKELDAEVTKKIQNEKKTQEAVVTPSPDTTGTGMSDQEFKDLLLEQAQKLILNTPIVGTMARLAVSTNKRIKDLLAEAPELKQILLRLPQTQEELDLLTFLMPQIADDYKKSFGQVYRDAREQAEQYLKIEKEAPVHNKSQQETETKQINELMTKWNATLPKEDVDKWLEEKLKDPSIYEDRSGVKYIRPNAIINSFVVDNADKLHDLALQKATAQASNTASLKTVNTLQNLEKNAIKSIGTSDLTPQKTQPVRVDLTDPQQVRTLSTEDREKALDDIVGKT
jgi:hypothetical protein